MLYWTLSCNIISNKTKVLGHIVYFKIYGIGVSDFFVSCS